MTKPTHAQLVDVIRRYQTANTRMEMNQADALAEKLVGPAPAPGVPAKKAKAK